MITLLVGVCFALIFAIYVASIIKEIKRVNGKKND